MGEQLARQTSLIALRLFCFGHLRFVIHVSRDFANPSSIVALSMHARFALLRKDSDSPVGDSEIVSSSGVVSFIIWFLGSAFKMSNIELRREQSIMTSYLGVVLRARSSLRGMQSPRVHIPPLASSFRPCHPEHSLELAANEACTSVVSVHTPFTRAN